MRTSTTSSLPLRLAVALIAVAVAWPVAAQRLNLDDYPRTDPDRLNEAHRRWLEEEVVWLITTEEREIFLRLESDTARDAFIDGFWRNRDPSPGTAENEYHDLHYERMAYANENFGRETPRDGWETDRGRVWILLGKPQSFNRLPNTNQAVPVEVWFYSVDPALGTPPFFYLIFFRDRGVGEYRLYSPAIDTPRALLNPAAQQELARGGGGGLGPGARSFASGEAGRAVEMLQRIDPELGNAASSLVPGEGNVLTVSPLRSEMVLARIFDIPQRIMPNASWAVRVLTGAAESEVRFETLPMSAVASVIIDPSGLPFVHYAARTVGGELNLASYDDRYYVTFEVSASVRDAHLRILVAGEPQVMQADLDEETVRRLRRGPVTYVERLPVIDGEVVLDLVLENNVTREFARSEFALRVPVAGGDEMDAGMPLLVLESQEIPEAADPYSVQYAFQVGPRFLIPAAGGPFVRDSTAQVFWQLMVPAGSGERLVRHSLRDAGGRTVIDKAVRVDASMRNGQGVIDHLATIDLAGLVAGRYELVMGVEGLEREHHVLPFEIVEPDDYVRPFVHAQRKPPAVGSETSLARARQLRTVGRTDDAIATTAQVLEREPDLEEALTLQIELLSDAGRYRELDELITPFVVESPNDADLLLLAGEVKAELGEHYDAIRYYERARIAGAPETVDLLNSLASEYFAEGNLERTRELLERSLEIDADQPQMQRLLDQLRDAG